MYFLGLVFTSVIYNIGTINENLFQIELLKQLKDATETTSTPPDGNNSEFSERTLNEAIA